MLPRALALVLALLLLAACGAEPSADDPPAGGATDAPEASDPADADPADEPTATPTALDTNVTDGCVDEAAAGTDLFPDKVAFTEASGVDVTYHDTHKIVEVTPPNLPDAEPIRYVLVQCGAEAPEGLAPDDQVIEVPVQRVVSLTTTNLPHFAELDDVERLVGVGTGAFVATPEVAAAVEAGTISDYADASGQPDLERLVAAEPDLLVIDGFGDTILDDVRRFVDAGVPTVVNADFNERTLLGRAEWLKFTSLFTNAEAAANDAYDEIAGRYEDRREAAQAYERRPRVLVNAPYEGTWFVPGGDSFLAHAIADAGGEYVFADDDATASLALDIETVLDAAADADVWIQAGSVHGTLDDLLAIDERLASFRAFQDGEVWALDRWLSDGGGYAVFEVAYTRADLLLDDLVHALHPEARAEIDPTFYGQVPSGDGTP